MPCNVGEYSLEGVEACTVCPGGYQCADQTNNPVQCLAGTYAPAGNDSCQDCEAGYECPTDGLSDHVACAAGYYQENTQQTSCNQCPKGKRSTWTRGYKTFFMLNSTEHEI